MVEGELGMTNCTVELPLTETCAAVKAKLVAMGVRSIPANRMKLQLDVGKYVVNMSEKNNENDGKMTLFKKIMGNPIEVKKKLGSLKRECRLKTCV